VYDSHPSPIQYEPDGGEATEVEDAQGHEPEKQRLMHSQSAGSPGAHSHEPL
jgi:hypothetical protein